LCHVTNSQEGFGIERINIVFKQVLLQQDCRLIPILCMGS
jgi:hypothetical protein